VFPFQVYELHSVMFSEVELELLIVRLRVTVESQPL
jgi:hypothetical protein